MNKILSKVCFICKTVYHKVPRMGLKQWNKSLFCSRPCHYKSMIGRIPYNKGVRGSFVHSTSSKKKISISLIGNKRNFGKYHSDFSKEKISNSINLWLSNQDNLNKVKERMSLRRGENHPRWVKDRSLLKKNDRRNDSAYKQWRIGVYKRDRFKCRMNNEECLGRIEAHHILSWSRYQELRYNINNGITLCRFHHPRKIRDEERLIPEFQSIVQIKPIL